MANMLECQDIEPFFVKAKATSFERRQQLTERAKQKECESRNGMKKPPDNKTSPARGITCIFGARV
jgi:hypothetical protein